MAPTTATRTSPTPSLEQATHSAVRGGQLGSALLARCHFILGLHLKCGENHDEHKEKSQKGDSEKGPHERTSRVIHTAEVGPDQREDKTEQS
jgi:hypothetical protein